MAGEKIVGKISEIQGDNVLIIRASGEQIVAKVGDALLEGDLVVTGSGARVGIDVDNNGQVGSVLIGESASVRFDSVFFDSIANMLAGSSQENPINVGEILTPEILRTFNEAIPSAGTGTANQDSQSDRVITNDFSNTVRNDDEEIPGAGPFSNPLEPNNAATIPGAGGETNTENGGLVEVLPDAEGDTGKDDEKEKVRVDEVKPEAIITNAAPVNTLSGAQTFVENTAAAITGISVTDVDGNLATTQISVVNGDLTVSLAGGATISAGANGSSALTLNGTETQINAALATLSYQGDTGYSGADTLTVLSTDSGGTPLTDTDTLAITVTADDTPALDLDANNSSAATGANYTGAFTENGGAVVIADVDTGITDADDTNIEGATISLTNAKAGDVLSNIPLPAGISVDGASTATNIILTGSASLADYQTAIQAIRFNNPNANLDATDRTINVTVTDGDSNSNTAVSTITVAAVNDAPTLAATTADDTLTENTDTTSGVVFPTVTINAIEA
ncbi:MAG: hypothetical protein ACI9NY_001891, partial [Kiritimatiellia bacterium]